jgi:uncharacterized protein YhhL (DUF1145 family)
VTQATIKYGVILLSTLLLVAFLVFISVVGVVHVGACPLSPNIPVYLLVMGFMGALRILLFYSCPFSYSKSVAGKWEVFFKGYFNGYYRFMNENSHD